MLLEPETFYLFIACSYILSSIGSATIKLGAPHGSTSSSLHFTINKNNYYEKE